MVSYKKPWIIVSAPILGTNWRFWVVPRKNLELQLVPRVPEGTNCKFWVVPTKKLGLQLVPRVLTADFGWPLQKNRGLQLVPRVLTADFDQRVVVLLKFSEMQLVPMVSRIDMLPSPLLFGPTQEFGRDYRFALVRPYFRPSVLPSARTSVRIDSARTAP